ncbi:MAG: arginase [Steroidobacteraceae bacterium]|jgi:arginase
MSKPVVGPSGSRASLPRLASLIGAPTDVGASDRGASMGPEALRVAGLHAALQARGLQVVDCGNVGGPPNPGFQRLDGYRNLREVAAWNRELHTAVHRELEASRLPILLGGDHSLSIGSISAVARYCRARHRPLRVLWLDAHADFNTRELSPSGSLHGMPVACLCGFGPPELHLGGATPAIEPQWVRQVGIRSVDPGERRFVHEQELPVFDMRSIDEMGVRRVMELALDGLTPDTHVHVSFDVDFLDPEIAPGVGTTVAGGMTYREAQLCMEMIADTGLIGSLDIMELNPALDVRNKTAALAVDLVESLFGKSTLMRLPGRSSSGWTRTDNQSARAGLEHA